MPYTGFLSLLRQLCFKVRLRCNIAGRSAGAGGSIRIEGNDVVLNAANVSGGAGGSGGGGAGGLGRIAVYYQNSFSANFMPGYLQQVGQPAAPTPTPTSPVIPTPPPAPAGWYASKYTYSMNVPHAVTAVDRGTFTDSFSYDANGNMTCRTEKGVTYLQAYNAENRIASITRLASGTCAAPGDFSVKWDFSYDGDGIRTGQSYTPYSNGQPGSAVITRYYFGGALETRGASVKKYYSFAGQLVAMKDETGIKYLLNDHLGSILAVTDSTGTVLSEQRYLPFGEVREDIGLISQTDFGYTSQRELDEGMGGIMDYKARFYSPYINQFSQPDPIIPDLYNPQSLNRYSYVLNNPIRYTDPTGYSVDCGMGDPFCSAGKYKPGGLIALYRHHFGDDAVRMRDSKHRKRLSAEIEDYMKNNPDYDPFKDSYLPDPRKRKGEYFNFMIFKDVREDYWRHRQVEAGDGLAGEVWPLMAYYDFNNTDYPITKWDPSRVDWIGTGLDTLSLALSFVALGAAPKSAKATYASYGAVATGVGSGIRSASKGDSAGGWLSFFGVLPPPIGPVASGISVIRDLFGGSYTIPYVPTIPR